VILGISSGNRLKSHTITCQISVLCSDYIKFGFISFLLRAMPRQSDPRKLRSWPVLFWAVLRASSTVPQRGFEDRDSARLQSSRYREGISSTEMPLGQRARSCETPSSNRPRVGPPRSPASSSGAPRSKTVAGAPCSRTSEPIHLRCAA
jgi:hypothetical protein